MAAAKREKATIISLAEARKASAITESHPHSAPATKSGYLESWYQEHTDRQGLIQENLKTKREKQEWQNKYNALNPSLAERYLYYVSVLGIIATLLAWAGVLVVQSL